MKYKHKPKLGDIIYSLPFIKHNGGGVLYLDPVSEHFPGQKENWENLFKWLMPLIKQQPYIEDVQIYEGQDYDIDLDEYMNTTHLKPYDQVNIVDNHFIAQGIKPIPYEKWLIASHIVNLGNYIVVANSDNHHDNIDYSTRLKFVDFIFIGTPKEATDFEKRCKRKFISYTLKDALDLAIIINYCRYFIGNQSLPLAIALGLGKKCYVEQSPTYPNCIMGNYNKL